jgi:hypothetical protein
MEIDATKTEWDAEIRRAKARLYVLEAMMSSLFCRLAAFEKTSAPSESGEVSAPNFIVKVAEPTSLDAFGD